MSGFQQKGERNRKRQKSESIDQTGRVMSPGDCSSARSNPADRRHPIRTSLRHLTPGERPQMVPQRQPFTAEERHQAKSRPATARIPRFCRPRIEASPQTTRKPDWKNASNSSSPASCETNSETRPPTARQTTAAMMCSVKSSPTLVWTRILRNFRILTNIRFSRPRSQRPALYLCTTPNP